MRIPVFLSAALVASTAARAELLRFDETPSGAHASVKIDGRTLDLDARISRPPKPSPGAALLLETESGDDLVPLALSRGLTVASLDLTKLPAAIRAQALRDLLPRLRQTTGVKRILARGRGEAGAALLEAGALLDGLMIHRADPFAAPLDPKGPKIIETFGSDAYWRPGRAAVPVEAAEGANRRRFFLAGAAGASGPTANCAAPVNARSIAPALRALLVVLDDWTRGVKPPPSRAPRLPDSGLVSAASLVWPKAPGLPAAPAVTGAVPAIDADGNEHSGLRLPDQALPIATFTGFNGERDKKGPPCLAGAALPFAANKAEREKGSDPRPSLVERYGSRAYFVATMRVVADRLVKERLLLKEDADAYVAAAKAAPF